MDLEPLMDLRKKKKINDEIYSIIFKIIDDQRNHINNINDRVKILEESRLQTLPPMPALKKKGTYANFERSDFSSNLSGLSRKTISKKKKIKKKSKKKYGRK